MGAKMKLYVAYDRKKNQVLEFEGETLFTNCPTLFERLVEWHNRLGLRPTASLDGMEIAEYAPYMTQEEFADRMKKLKAYADEDRERAHVMMDQAMCGILKALGYDEGVRIFEETQKWYV